MLFTNYVRYVDEFVGVAIDTLRRKDSRFTALSVPGALYEPGELTNAEAQIAAGQWRRHQMPAYHLMAEGRTGITLVNIGVGPSNAKTICDHVAVLRPEVWLMIGHCGGLRPSQTIGDYVLAHAYLRDDHVLDDVLPPEVPLPAIAEVQNALFDATTTITGEDEDSVKRRLRTGTVVTTDDRNWELRYAASALRFNQSRAVAIDMESATVAAQGYRFRVPYGTLLCVSDKPLHGELKLPGQANAFYERAISQHLRIGIEALEPAAAGRRRTAQPQAAQLRRAAAALAYREDLTCVGDLHLRRGRAAVLADRDVLGLADDLDGLADERGLQIVAIFLRQARHRRCLDRHAEVGCRTEVLLAVEIIAVALLGRGLNLELEQGADRLGRGRRGAADRLGRDERIELLSRRGGGDGEQEASEKGSQMDGQTPRKDYPSAASMARACGRDKT